MGLPNVLSLFFRYGFRATLDMLSNEHNKLQKNPKRNAKYVFIRRKKSKFTWRKPCTSSKPDDREVYEVVSQRNDAGSNGQKTVYKRIPSMNEGNGLEDELCLRMKRMDITNEHQKVRERPQERPQSSRNVIQPNLVRSSS